MYDHEELQLKVKRLAHLKVGGYCKKLVIVKLSVKHKLKQIRLPKNLKLSQGASENLITPKPPHKTLSYKILTENLIFSKDRFSRFTYTINMLTSAAADKTRLYLFISYEPFNFILWTV